MPPAIASDIETKLERQGVLQIARSMPAAIRRWMERDLGRGARSIDLVAGFSMITLCVFLLADGTG